MLTIIIIDLEQELVDFLLIGTSNFSQHFSVFINANGPIAIQVKHFESSPSKEILAKKKSFSTIDLMIQDILLTLLVESICLKSSLDNTEFLPEMLVKVCRYFSISLSPIWRQNLENICLQLTNVWFIFKQNSHGVCQWWDGFHETIDWYNVILRSTWFVCRCGWGFLGPLVGQGCVKLSS